MDHDECDPCELESFLQSCLDSANATLLDADDPLSGGGPLSTPPVHSGVLGGALSSPAPVLNSRVVRPAASSAPAPLSSAIGGSALSTPASRNTRVVANGLPAAVSVSAPVPVITQPLLTKSAGAAGGRHKPLNGVLMVPTPVHAAAAPARPPPGPQASPVPAASPFSAARSPGQSPAPAAGSPVSLSQARVITSLAAAAPAAVVPALPHGVIISQSGALLSQSSAAILSQAGAPSVVGDYRPQQQQPQQQQRAQTQQRQSVLTGAFHQPGSGLIAAGTIVPNGLQNLQVVSAPQNGGVMHLVQPTQPQAAAARQQKAGAGKQPQLLPKTLAPSLPLAKQTLTQPPMMLAPGGLGCGGGGPMVLTPVMIQQPGGGHQIQYILREQPNLLFPAQAAAGGKAPPQQAVLLPTTGGGQTVLLQHPGQLLPQAGPVLQPAIRLVAPPLPPQLYAVAPQQPVVPQALQLAAPQQPELLKPAAQQQPTQQPSPAVQAAQRNRASGGSKKKRREDMPAHHLSQQSMSQPQKKAFVDLEDIMKKSGIFGDMDDEPGLHTEPDVKAEAAAEPSHQTVVQPLQGAAEGLQPACPRLAPPPSAGLGAAPGYHGPSTTASKVVLNGAAALVSAPPLPAVSLLSGSLAQPVLSYAAGPGRPHLLAAASQPLTQPSLLQAAPRVSAPAPPPTTSSGTASSVLGNLLSQPSRQPRPPQPQSQSQPQSQTHSVSGAAQPAVAAPAAALHVPGGLSLAVAPAVSAAVQAVSAGGSMVPVVKSSAAVSVPLSQSLYHVGTVAAGQSPALQNVFLENLIKNQLQVRTNSKKKKKEPVTRVSSVRSVSASAVSSPSSVESRRTASVESGPAAVSPAARVAASAADNSVTSTTPAEPPSALRPPISCAPAASSVSFSSSLPQTSFTVAGAGAATPPPPPSASTARSSVPSAPRQLAPAPVAGAAGGRSPAAAVSTAASSAEPTHKVAIQLSAENQQELNRVQLRMQLLLRADKPLRDAEELRRLESTRQKILATGQQVRWPVPSSGAAAASAVMSPPAAAAPSSAAPLQLASRGTKRPQEPGADQRTDRFLQQLSRDQLAALQPDTESPFQSVADAVRRLAAYHVFQEPPPGHQQLAFEEQHFQARAEYIHNKRHNMYNKYRRLLLKDSMRLHPSSESVQILRYLNQHDRDQLDQERRAAAARAAGGGATPRPSKVRRDAAESSQPAPAADAPVTPVKAEPAPASVAGGDVPLRPDPTLRHVRLPPPAASLTAADADFDRLFDEPLVNGHGDGARLEDDLNEQVQSAIKSILSIPREPELTGPGGPGPGGGSGGGGPGPTAQLADSPPVPSRFNINASFFNADDTGEDSEALDEAVRSILL